jgi:hypothetical protein
MDAVCSSDGGRKMSDKEKGALTRLNITVAKNGFEIEASYEPKKSLSQKKGWVPSPWCEPDKFVASSREALTKKINELLKDCKDCSK